MSFSGLGVSQRTERHLGHCLTSDSRGIHSCEQRSHLQRVMFKFGIYILLWCMCWCMYCITVITAFNQSKSSKMKMQEKFHYSTESASWLLFSLPESTQKAVCEKYRFLTQNAFSSQIPRFELVKPRATYIIIVSMLTNLVSTLLTKLLSKAIIGVWKFLETFRFFTARQKKKNLRQEGRTRAGLQSTHQNRDTREF